MKLPHLLTIFLLIITLVFCKKEEKKDTSPPVLIIEEPVMGAIYQVPDTITITGTVSDNELVEKVIIALKDQKDTKALPSITIYPGKKFEALEISYPLNDLHLQSGKYYLEITATDDEHRITKYIDINISEAAVTLEGIYILIANDAGINMYTLDTATQLVFFKYVDGDYNNSAINSRDQLLYTMGSYTGHLRAIDPQTGEIVWARNAQGTSGERYFQGFSYQNRNVYYSLYEGDIGGINHLGVGTYDGQARPGNVAERFLELDDKIVVVERTLTDQSLHLVTYTKVGGTFVQSKNISGMPVGMFSLDDSRILLFINNKSTQEISIYHVDGNYFDFQKETLTGDSIDCVTPTVGSNYIFSKGNSGFYRFDASIFDINTFRSSLPDVNYITYDKLNNEVWIALDEGVVAFDYETAGFIRGVSTYKSTKAVYLLYNK